MDVQEHLSMPSPNCCSLTREKGAAQATWQVTDRCPGKQQQRPHRRGNVQRSESLELSDLGFVLKDNRVSTRCQGYVLMLVLVHVGAGSVPGWFLKSELWGCRTSPVTHTHHVYGIFRILSAKSLWKVPSKIKSKSQKLNEVETTKISPLQGNENQAGIHLLMTSIETLGDSPASGAKSLFSSQNLIGTTVASF